MYFLSRSVRQHMYSIIFYVGYTFTRCVFIIYIKCTHRKILAYIILPTGNGDGAAYKRNEKGGLCRHLAQLTVH